MRKLLPVLILCAVCCNVEPTFTREDPGDDPVLSKQDKQVGEITGSPGSVAGSRITVDSWMGIIGVAMAGFGGLVALALAFYLAYLWSHRTRVRLENGGKRKKH